MQHHVLGVCLGAHKYVCLWVWVRFEFADFKSFFFFGFPKTAPRLISAAVHI